MPVDPYLEGIMKHQVPAWAMQPDTTPDLDTPPPKLKIETFSTTASPEFYYYLGWTDLRATQDKLIRERKAFLQRWTVLKENLERLFTDQLENTGTYNQVNHGNGCPNPFYQMGVEDALDVANRDPLHLIVPYHDHYVAIPWKSPGPDVCSNCMKEFEQFIWMEEGPCYNSVYCSEGCMQQGVIEYLEKDNMVRLMAAGQLEREPFFLDQYFEKLILSLSTLPARSNYSGKAKPGFDFA